jgi:hypothetical protein
MVAMVLLMMAVSFSMWETMAACSGSGGQLIF